MTSRDAAGAPHATQTVAGSICPYLRDRNNDQTVHPVPHKTYVQCPYVRLVGTQK
jgi:hypothetical protein